LLILWDEKKALKNFKKHGITFEEASTVLLSNSAITFEDPDSIGERRYLSVGFSVKARLLFVVHCERSENEIRIISARKATKREARQYEEKL